jgi:hypothetical protein
LEPLLAVVVEVLGKGLIEFVDAWFHRQVEQLRYVVLVSVGQRGVVDVAWYRSEKERQL